MNWYVKEFSKLTNVSVRTLHHYDAIGLLSPSIRLENRYRLYSEEDLLKLERIVALKFFGFNLKQGTAMMKHEQDVVTSLKQQQKCLEQQEQHLTQAIELITHIISDHKPTKPIDWSKIATLIRTYQMTNELHKTWAGQVFSPEQLKQFAELQTKFSEEQLKEYEHRWKVLIEKVKQYISTHPGEPVSPVLAQEWLDLLDEVYGGYPELKDALSLAYKYNKIPDASFDQELWDAVGKAVHELQTNKQK